MNYNTYIFLCIFLHVSYKYLYFTFGKMEKMLKIGWIGTGVMGKSMCRHLMKNGHKLKIFNRTKSKTEELVSEGCEYKEPLEIAKECEIIFIMAGYPKDVDSIIFGDIIMHMTAN